MPLKHLERNEIIDIEKIFCENCGEEILEDEPCVQVRNGILLDGEFEPDEEVKYYHQACYEY